MRPKAPSSTNIPKVNPPTRFELGSNRLRPDADVPLLHQPPLPGTQRPAASPDVPRDNRADASAGSSRVEIADLPGVQSQSPSGLSAYLLKAALLRNMQPADDDGFRFVVGRKFVDVKDTGTVHVEFDPGVAAYRATDLYKKLPPGPALFRNPGEATWSPARQVESANPLKRPLSEDFDGEAQVPAKQALNSPLSAHEATTQLLDDSLLRIYPLLTLGQRVELLRSHNLSPAQHVQLRNDLMVNPEAMPAWAAQHQLRSMDANDPTRFDQLHAEIEPLLLPVRNGTLHSELVDFDKSVSREFLDAFLARLGYLRNSSDCLYRTDIPGLFRADERTPFEFYNDGHMLPRLKHPRGATTGKPISATVSHELLKMYGGKGTDTPDPEYLRYNSQRNLYPGKKPGESNNDSSPSDDDWTEASDLELDSERNYETTRHDQQFTFAYVIDTRKMEVVLNEENRLLNLSAQDKSSWFPDDDLEALISTSRRGIESARLWLLDSTFTRAAKVDDIGAEAQKDQNGGYIEERTHSGAENRAEYDALIDAVARAGKPILELPVGKDWFANDIVWPE